MNPKRMTLIWAFLLGAICGGITLFVTMNLVLSGLILGCWLSVFCGLILARASKAGTRCVRVVFVHAAGAAAVCILLTGVAFADAQGNGASPALLLAKLLAVVISMPLFLFFAMTVLGPRDPSICRKCSYNLSGNRSGRCPKCGKRIKNRQRAELVMKATEDAG